MPRMRSSSEVRTGAPEASKKRSAMSPPAAHRARDVARGACTELSAEQLARLARLDGDDLRLAQPVALLEPRLQLGVQPARRRDRDLHDPLLLRFLEEPRHGRPRDAEP